MNVPVDDVLLFAMDAQLGGSDVEVSFRGHTAVAFARPGKAVWGLRHFPHRSERRLLNGSLVVVAAKHGAPPPPRPSDPAFYAAVLAAMPRAQF